MTNVRKHTSTLLLTMAIAALMILAVGITSQVYAGTDISKAEVTFDKTYYVEATGAYEIPLGVTMTPTVTLGDAILVEGQDYTAQYYDNSQVGSRPLLNEFPTAVGGYICLITGKGSYKGENESVDIWIGEKNPIEITTKTVTIKASKLKKKDQVTDALTISNIKGTIFCDITDGSKKAKKALKVGKRDGKITVKKGTKKGTYKVQVLVWANGDHETYAARSNFADVIIIVK